MLPAREATHVIKKEAVTPTTGKPVEDLQGPNASYTASVADALIRSQGQKRPLACRKKEAEAAKGSAPFLKTYQESQHSQTRALIPHSVFSFYHYQESQHSQTSNCIFMQQFSASVSAYTRRRGS